MNSFQELHGWMIVTSKVMHAMDDATVGTCVLNSPVFWRYLVGALRLHDTSTDTTPGQSFVELPEDACKVVSCGEGLVPAADVDPTPFVIRPWRGENEEFLKRQYAAKTTRVSAVVYTMEAYLDDPDTRADEQEWARVAKTCADYVLVLVAAYGGPNPRYTLPSGRTVGLCSPTRLEKNIAGGNHDYDGLTPEELVELRAANDKRWAEWRVVAD